jgi:hypothetical protein
MDEQEQQPPKSKKRVRNAAPPRPKEIINEERFKNLWEQPRHRIFEAFSKSTDARNIIKYFLQPLAGDSETWTEASFKERLEMMFQTKSVDVLFYRAKRDFKMIGTPAPEGDSSSEARNVLKNDVIVVRRDHYNPNRVELQIFTKFNQELETRYYILTKRQFAWIKRSMECKTKD